MMDETQRRTLDKLWRATQTIYRGDPKRQAAWFGNLLPEERTELLKLNLEHATAAFRAMGVSAAEAVGAVEALGSALRRAYEAAGYIAKEDGQ